MSAAQAAQDLLRAHARGPLHRRRAEIGTPLADAGYCSEDNLTIHGPDRLIATGKHHNPAAPTPVNGHGGKLAAAMAAARRPPGQGRLPAARPARRRTVRQPQAQPGLPPLRHARPGPRQRRMGLPEHRHQPAENPRHRLAAQPSLTQPPRPPQPAPPPSPARPPDTRHHASLYSNFATAPRCAANSHRSRSDVGQAGAGRAWGARGAGGREAGCAGGTRGRARGGTRGRARGAGRGAGRGGGTRGSVPGRALLRCG